MGDERPAGQAGMIIRKMHESDIDQVYGIEEDLFPVPWPKRSFIFEVGNTRTTYAVVALERDIIVGYAIGWFVEQELHIGNVAVRRDRQGTGVGRGLVEDLLREASTRGSSYITLEVRASNVKAIGLYRKYGFRGVAIRKQYYTDNGEDALVMLAEVGREGSDHGSEAAPGA